MGKKTARKTNKPVKKQDHEIRSDEKAELIADVFAVGIVVIFIALVIRLVWR